MIDNITCIILSGGKSSRMGEDKAFMPLSGKPIIEILIDKLSLLFKDLIIITNSPQLYKKYGLKTYADILKDRGPLGGIHAGLTYSKNRYSFVVACDMPYVNLELVRFMSATIEGYDLVVPEENGQFEPLCAFYSKNCIKTIEDQLHKNNLKIRDFFSFLKVRTITENEIAAFDAEGKCFVNINTRKNYQTICRGS